MLKTIKTRIQQKHATEAVWNNNASFVPLSGELIIYDADDNYSYQRLKVGDGKTRVTELPYYTETDPTVPAWAKAATKPEYTASEVGAVNPNLLDNWYFADPINQRGQTEYTASYTIDRWYCGRSLTINDGSITYDGYLTQQLERGSELFGKTLTLSYLREGELVTGTATLADSYELLGSTSVGRGILQYNDKDVMAVLIPAGTNVIAIKLELGTAQTLAHQDSSGNWVLNEIPDKGLELLKCIQSTADHTDTYANKVIAISDDLANYLPLTGGKLTGQLRISRDLPLVNLINTKTGRETQLVNNTSEFTALTNSLDNLHYTSLMLGNEGLTSADRWLQFNRRNGGAMERYSVYHTGNKPTPAEIGAAASDHGTHVTFGTATPVAAGTAAVGTATTVSRSDHVHPAQTTVSGNAGSATKLATARTIDGVSFNGSAAINHFGTCSTDAAIAAKTVACTGFTLVTGARITVLFTKTNTAANPTLNVNSTGAKAIYYRNAAISAGYLANGRVYEFVYDGSQYELVGDIDTNSTYTLSNITGTLAVGKGGTGATTFTPGAALIGNGTGAVTTRAITNMTAKNHITYNTNLMTTNTLAYWNGAYSSTGSSNLTYCVKGAFGDVVTHAASEFATASHSQAASTISAGTLAGKVLANATAAATITTAQVRNIYAGTSSMTDGSTALTAGTIYLQY